MTKDHETATTLNYQTSKPNQKNTLLLVRDLMNLSECVTCFLTTWILANAGGRFSFSFGVGVCISA
jgi:hypothetical protein